MKMYNALEMIGKIGVIIISPLLVIGIIIGCLYVIVQLMILLGDALHTLGFRRKHR